eukprot:CAMPEP_0197848068 /NCGR_PEP_ID=MMETSP1438-20131217/7907_1 /TAXON_ID=1461541 /ORGANISM="Pterosperma sp., Strain CCMP1384" /LENGTH=169 /DNA_ID=CAMNT_0043460195 /DNA_START=174 /DNA_END=680 /DNA_ORIENTATION=+
MSSCNESTTTTTTTYTSYDAHPTPASLQPGGGQPQQPYGAGYGAGGPAQYSAPPPAYPVPPPQAYPPPAGAPPPMAQAYPQPPGPYAPPMAQPVGGPQMPMAQPVGGPHMGYGGPPVMGQPTAMLPPAPVVMMPSARPLLGEFSTHTNCQHCGNDVNTVVRYNPSAGAW